MQGIFKLEKVYLQIKTSYQENIVSYCLFYIAFPLVYLFRLLKVSPNVVTTLGNLAAILAFVFLLGSGTSLIAALLWFLSVLLDHSDGALARVTERVRKHKFRYDHFSDILKISFLFLLISLIHENNLVVICATFNSVMFLFREVLLLNLNFAQSGQDDKNVSLKVKSSTIFFQNFKNIFATINGHSTLVFGLLFVDEAMHAYVIFYFSLIIIKDLALFSVKLLKI